MAKHVLITGFEPFGGEKVNPSALVARSFEGRLVGGRPIAVRVFPVETRTLGERLARAIAEESPDVVVLTGQAGGRAAIAVERVALNVLDFPQPDSVGVMRKNDVIARGGPEARLSPLPVSDIAAAWIDAGIPGYISNAAGTYVCNQALYELLALCDNAPSPVVGGLVHFPYLTNQAAVIGPETTPSMAIDLMKRAMELMIEKVVAWMDQRAIPDRGSARAAKGSQVWIPRGVKEVER